MRVVVQRVKEASVTVADEVIGQIGQGLLILFGVSKDDTEDKTVWMVNKLIDLRIFADEQGKMNLSLRDVKGQALIVSQFTLYGNCSNGRRPDFFEAGQPDFAEKCYLKFIKEMQQALGTIQTGKFGAKMEVALINDGPITLILDR
ncbi:MAG: D-aminoacyl-tRNA deacylase [Chlamydiales bacterium]|nr:D-aminoacyl-tRNA deacylase [Chlamydiales bacterium]